MLRPKEVVRLWVDAFNEGKYLPRGYTVAHRQSCVWKKEGTPVC